MSANWEKFVFVGSQLGEGLAFDGWQNVGLFSFRPDVESNLESVTMLHPVAVTTECFNAPPCY